MWLYLSYFIVFFLKVVFYLLETSVILFDYCYLLVLSAISYFGFVLAVVTCPWCTVISFACNVLFSCFCFDSLQYSVAFWHSDHLRLVFCNCPCCADIFRSQHQVVWLAFFLFSIIQSIPLYPAIFRGTRSSSVEFWTYDPKVVNSNPACWGQRVVSLSKVL